MKYLVVGAGGVGGTISFYMKKAGLDVSLIARGESLENIRRNGLILERAFDGTEESAAVDACSDKEYSDSPDIVFLCTKSYSVDSVLPFLKTLHEKALVIPLLNVFTTGDRLREALGDDRAADGCIYVSSDRTAPGVIRQSVPILRILFGKGEGRADEKVLERAACELKDAGLDVTLSEDMRKAALEKFSYVSPIGALGVYHEKTAGAFQKPGRYRDDFISMIEEIRLLSEKMGHPISEDTVHNNLSILDSLPPEETTSMQRDILSNRKSEADGLVHEIARLGRKYGTELETYERVSKALSSRGLL